MTTARVTAGQACRWFHGYVGSCLARGVQVDGDVPPFDDDMDYRLDWDGYPVWVSVACAGPHWSVRAWAVAASGFKVSAALLREVNQLSSTMLLGKTFVHGDCVVVSSHIVAECRRPGVAAGRGRDSRRLRRVHRGDARHRLRRDGPVRPERRGRRQR